MNPHLTFTDAVLALHGRYIHHDGEIEVAGPRLAGSLTELGLIDEYRIYLHPAVLGRGTPYFAGPPPALRLAAHDRIGDDVVRLSYVPA